MSLRVARAALRFGRAGVGIEHRDEAGAYIVERRAHVAAPRSNELLDIVRQGRLRQIIRLREQALDLAAGDGAGQRIDLHAKGRKQLKKGLARQSSCAGAHSRRSIRVCSAGCSPMLLG